MLSNYYLDDDGVKLVSSTYDLISAEATFIEWLHANLEMSGWFPVDERCIRRAKQLGIRKARWQKLFQEESQKVNPRGD